MPGAHEAAQRGAEIALARDHEFVAYARRWPAAFCQYVLRDEETHRAIHQAPHHVAWHQLCSDRDRLIVWSHIRSGKTTQIAVGRVLWEIGRDPTQRILILSNTHAQAVKIVRNLARYIEGSHELKRVWPELKPGTPWTDSAITVKRPVLSRDATVTASGVHGNVLGSRFDLIVIDDILDWENSRTPEERQKLVDWIKATVIGRLTPRGRVWVIGTAFHPDDLMHRFARDGWRAVTYPVAIGPPGAEETGELRWPEQWPARLIQQARRELGSFEFARQLLCQARDDSQARCKEEWIRACKHNGIGRELCYGLQEVPAGYTTYTGVDLGVKQHSGADLTVFFTIIVHPNGDREILNIESGRWTSPEIVARIVDHHRRYFSMIVVESNAAQEYIVQFTRQLSAVPVKPFETTKKKYDPVYGVEAVFTEMEARKWIIPCDSVDRPCHPEVEAWLNDCRYFDPTGHTGDRLMASWFARQRAERGTQKLRWTTIDTLTR